MKNKTVAFQFFFLTLLLLNTTLGSSQSISKSFGETFPSERNRYLHKIFKIEDKFFCIYVEHGKTEEILIKQFSSNLGLEKENILSLDTRKEKNELANIFSVKNKIWLFYKAYTKKKEHHLNLLIFDPETFTAIKDDIILTFEDNDNVKTKKIDFDIYFNTDSTIYAAVADQPNKQNNEKFDIHLFSENHQPLNTIAIDSKEDDENLIIIDININRKGIVFIQTFKQNTNEYILTTYKGGIKQPPYKIPVTQYLISDLRFISSNDTVVVYSGLGVNGSWSCNASYYLKLNYSTGSVITEKKDTLSKDFINKNQIYLEFLDNNKRSIKNSGIQYTSIKNIIPRSDGGAVLIAEQETVEDQSNTYFDAYGVMRTYSFIYYVNQNIILLNINPQGKIDWSKQLPKKQITTNDGGYYNSFKQILTNEKLYFIYNDNNINGSTYIPEKDVYQNMELKKMNYVTNAYSIDIAGNIEKENLFSFAELGTYISPENIFQVTRNEVIIVARYGKDDRLISLKWASE